MELNMKHIGKALGICFAILVAALFFISIENLFTQGLGAILCIGSYPAVLWLGMVIAKNPVRLKVESARDDLSEPTEAQRRTHEGRRKRRIQPADAVLSE